MNKTFFYAMIWAVAGIIAQGCTPPRSMSAAEVGPNVIIIFADDMGYSDLGCYGATAYKTPNLDRLAAEGAKFNQFYSAQPVCSASRAALLTGCYSNRVGIHSAFMPGAKIGLNPEETTIADMLKSKGYQTAIFGKWHLGDHPKFMPLQQGFDEYFGIPYSNDMWPKHPQQGPVFNFKELPLYENEKIIDTLWDQSNLTTMITERCTDFIKRNKNKPFFLYVPHPQPHVPLFVSNKFKGKSSHGLYGDVIMELDWSVGMIMKTLKKYNLEKNTLLVFTSDNGPWLVYGNHSGSALPLREGKGTVWEGGVREPCIMRLPGVIKPGTVIETPLIMMDLMPTISALCATNLPEKTIDGKDIVPIITGKTSISPHEAFYFYYNANELQAIRYGDWKMYFPHKYNSIKGQPQGQDGKPSQYKPTVLKEVELYNLKSDVSETKNVANDHPDVIRTIQRLAETMRSKLGDALTGVEGTENRKPGRIN
jgi:arylsulfatase